MTTKDRSGELHFTNGPYHDTPLNTSNIPQDTLNIEGKTRSNPLPWNGQFSPQLAQGLLRKYADPDSVILDPFVGSGTVLMEAGRIGLTAFGSEINPAAIAMSKIYQFINIPLEERQLCLSKANAILEKRFSNTFPLSQDQEAVKLKLVDLVLTSPPYINVFNYHQRFRTSMEALHWDLLRVARSEFGANRKHRSNRFLTVIQFCLDISQTLTELKRVCTGDSRLIFVVGRESTVCGTRFFNGEIVAEISHRALGFELSLRQERVFLNRYGQKIYEDILHFSPRKSQARDLDLKEVKQIAQQVLESAYATAPAKSFDGLKAALANIEKVSPSPVFNPKRSSGFVTATTDDLFQREVQRA